ncbi:3-hydroxyacyl-CoA dehydrogenase NAD-binding domain-containing protein [Citrobacter portucalensis]|uniref:3-hydroxyacyl-CoA dehydrogenase NAD-binding domain-containing protein n=1 Tax=Citrobacter portucalensis TaxID=1639133 RepID=A0AAW5W707_9ENTR|nr:3-hydroxyacyl-CoA dehydrogenase NAD-binding domain-containing protein [Citrobacter portucalensis]MCX9004395.1 3-hydroxyacyl-CoA dehydrogenase NAD-binding domain-containing protein [Citrobacter portucalensis]MCX9058991.1 3-hydroxyacyl-CoA dehydrogenase NAD-binding domain-containing protein [Citrobacter portucalensis]
MGSLPTGKILKRPVAIIGAGTLGRRIALMMTAHGAHVRLYDRKNEACHSASCFIQENLLPLTALTGGTDHEITKVEFCDTLEEAIKDSWLIIEAIPEILDLKISLFAQLDKLAPADAILASNSSSYPSSKLIGEVSVERLSHVVNTHFYMPPVQNAVEIGSCGYTIQAVIDELILNLKKYGFSPFVVGKESIGFIFNRVWAAVKRECLEVVATGVSTPEDLDAIYKLSLGAQAGPFELMDKIGLDVVYDIEKHYAEVDPARSENPLKLLEQYIKQGRLGVKSGSGFYQYNEKGNKVATH